MYIKKQLFYLGFLLVFLILPIQVYGLDPNRLITQYIIDSWQTKDGLPQNSANCIIQDKNGYVWFGTEEGLVRFDGIKFTVFNQDNTPAIKNNYIYTMCLDKSGRLWLGTHGGGLTLYDNGKFSTFDISDGLSNTNITALSVVSDNSLWIGTKGGGLNHYKDGKFTTLTVKDGLANNIIQSIFQDLDDGSLWIGTTEGLNHYQDGKFVDFTTANSLSNNNILSIYKDREKNLWIGTTAGLNKFSNGKFSVITSKNGLSQDRISSIFQDKDGNLWIGTQGAGVNRLQGDKIDKFDSKDILGSSAIISFYEDAEQNLWIGTQAAGLYKLKDGKFKVFSTKEGLSEDIVFPVYEDSFGNMWIGTQATGLNLYKNGKLTIFTTKDGLVDNTILSLCQSKDGSMWIGTSKGLNHYQDGKFTSFTTKDGLSNNTIADLYEDLSGNLWIGTSGGGLNSYKNGKFTVFTTKDGLSGEIIQGILQDKQGNLWIGTQGKGINRYKDGKFTSFGSKDGLASEIILSFYEDKVGDLWICTLAGGIARLHNGKISSFTTKEGLPVNTIYHLLEDKDGQFWGTTNKGIIKFSKQEVNQLLDGQIKKINVATYGLSDGMRHIECNGGFLHPGAWQTPDGRILFSTVVGVVIADPKNIKYNTRPVPIVIENLVVDDKTFEAKESLEFTPGKKRWEFHYTGLSFTAPEKLQFRYQLEGFNNEWVDVGTSRVVSLANLSPGHYSFKLQAKNEDGLWTETPVKLDFYLEPYFYQTIWFYFLCGLIAIGSGVAIYKLRVNQLEKRQNELSRLVAERTKDLLLEKQKVEEQKAIIEADNERKTKELEDARLLQLSILPKQMPVLPTIEISAYMKPAAEVGGDYYDFYVSDDMTLTVMVGDATGHGLKAGWLVTAVKSLFSTLAQEPDITYIFQRSNQVIKQMKIRSLYMAATMMKVKEHQLSVCIAGMPPLLIYRSKTQEVEEVKIPGVPLGSMNKYTYKVKDVELLPGDILVLMSDGFPEQFNPQGEILGYQTVSLLFKDIATKPPNEIIECFIKASENWAQGTAQNDDMTFVVLKAKPYSSLQKAS
jgi:ligand-binding sensor domain-containing protein/serine phosphatase RsbU (regulator of sigma subunit)